MHHLTLRAYPRIWNNNITDMSPKDFPQNQRRAQSLDESSDPGLSLTHRKACQCVAHKQPAFEHIPKRLQRPDHITVMDKNHELASRERKRGDTDKTAYTTVLGYQGLGVEPLSGEHSWDSWASCDFYRDLTEKPHNQPEITTGFLFIHPLCNPSGFAEQPVGKTLNTWCSTGSHKHLLIPVVIFFLSNTTHQRGWAISLSFIIKIEMDTVIFMENALKK